LIKIRVIFSDFRELAAAFANINQMQVGLLPFYFMGDG
jgi:hypothetical protein